ncbi:MAG: aminoacyl-histidine dipeptidase [Eubacteriaceae bacterium]
MKNLFLNHSPKKILNYFSEISEIPRGSANEKAISDYLVEFSKKRNLEVYQDTYNNILIKKPATSGLENSPTVILQGHMDMVCEKNKNTIHDFSTDAIKFKIINDHIYADNTTLGADNGIAIAMFLAILDSNEIAHPNLEILLTVEEETGLSGALNFDTRHLDGKLLINLDSEDDTEILSSCAGGVRICHRMKLKTIKRPPNFLYYNISISGLNGGHSGMDINKEKANANKLLARVLYSIKKEMKIHIVDISGGAKDNAIPREAETLILIDKTEKENLELIIKQAQRNFLKEYSSSDNDIKVTLSYLDDTVNNCLDKSTTDKIINLLMILPNGVQSMNTEIKDLVESSINIGIVKIEQDYLSIHSAARSSLISKKKHIINMSYSIAEIMDIECAIDSSYPGWAYEKNSPLRKLAVSVYNKLYGEQPKIVAIHAGVECGIFKEKIPELDIISFGPNIYDVHTPNEHISISSIKKTWEFLLEILKTLK